MPGGSVLLLAVVLVVIVVVGKWIIFGYYFLAVFYYMQLTMMIGWVFFVSPAHLADFRGTLERDAGVGAGVARDGSIPSRVRGGRRRRQQQGSAAAAAAAVSHSVMGSVVDGMGSLMSRALDRTGLDYYVELARGRTQQEMDAFLVEKGERLGIRRRRPYPPPPTLVDQPLRQQEEAGGGNGRGGHVVLVMDPVLAAQYEDWRRVFGDM